ncbi:P-loop NTPase fold protein [Streptomyces sp. NPDC090032]|uniref:P-loop NTPase fold protein n=1 Tax=unclassified Streptomyces TaxID=2593676 RepID=UPI00371E9459
MAPQLPWTIEDIAIGHSREDLFDHHSVARQLARTITAAGQSLAIGLLGPFGSGKSSVVQLLKTELAVNKKWAVLHVSAEHHSGVARARALMYALLDEAHRQDLISADEFASQRACMEGGRQHTLPRPGPRSTVPGRSGLRRYVLAAGTGLAWVGTMLGVLWLIGVALVIFGHRFGVGEGVPALTWFAAKGATSLTAVLVSAAAISAVLAAGKESALQTLKAYEITLTSPRPDSTDELEQAFTRLLLSVDRRLVIAVDDIDRLAAADVLEALTTLRSFLLTGHQQRVKQPVFVLSCDESIVREAIVGVRPGLARRPADTQMRVRGDQGPVAGEPGEATTRAPAAIPAAAPSPAPTAIATRKATEEAAQEYLNKLFTVRLVLPAPGDADLRDYAAELLLHRQPQHPAVAELGGQAEVRTLLDVLVHQGVRDPRHVIRLLNSFFTDFQLAQFREMAAGARPPRIAAREVTGYPVALARLTVLRHDFRDLYDAIRAEEDLLHRIDDALLGPEQGLLDPLLKSYVIASTPPRPDFESHPGLRYLLATAARARVDRPARIGPLLTLGSSQASRLLGSEMATHIQQELIGRDGAAFARRLAAADALPRVLEAAAAALGAARPGQDLDNAVTAAIIALGETAEQLANLPLEETRPLRALTDIIARRRPEMTLAVPSHLLVPLLGLTDEAHLPRLLKILLDPPEDAGEALLWAEALIRLPAGAHATELAPAVDSYFRYLTEGGEDEDLAFWIDDDRSAHRSAWPASAFAALLTRAARSEAPHFLAPVATAVIDHADIHRWNRPLALALLTCLQGDLPASREAIRVLAHSTGPDREWEDSSNSETYDTLAAQLTGAVAVSCAEDEDTDIMLAGLELLTQWLPAVKSLTDSAKVTHTIAEALGAVAGDDPLVAGAVGDVLRGLPENDAALCVRLLADRLLEHRGPGDTIGSTLRDVLVEYLHRAPDAAEPPVRDALEHTLSALTSDLTAHDAMGRFARETLPALLTTSIGCRRATDMAALLLSAVPANQPTIAEELMPSVHVVFQDDAARARHLPQAVQLMHQLVSYNQTGVALSFLAHYVTEAAVDVTCLRWYAQHWSSLDAVTRDRAGAAAQRTDLPHELRDCLVTHLAESETERPWDYANELWPHATAQQRVTLLAAARGRAPELAQRAEESDADVLCAALVEAGDDLDHVLRLMGSATLADESILAYVRATVNEKEWAPDRCDLAMGFTTTPGPLWTLAEELLTEGQTPALRGADLVASLITRHPAAIPADLISILTQPLREADEPLAEALGHALRGHRKLASKLRDAMAGHSAATHQRRRNAAFKKASGLT